MIKEIITIEREIIQIDFNVKIKIIKIKLKKTLNLLIFSKFLNLKIVNIF